MARGDCGDAALSGGRIESIVQPTPTIGGARISPRDLCGHFEMPLHYPRYTKADYESMPEWKVDCLLAQYGMPVNNENVEQKRKFAMGAFLWPN
ncbi:hypothetical protein AQUCO_03700060v1 [Aquilegia coerulea]|uniref:DUF7722 domain-containing protein n=1 Tax=Aquilegia coerulea TaxID=218851 RepID=A0A2G5CUE8_AQUCA|nr:hypothetical protein AQUCO_03700060v1 [Aquilegia coerulea]